ncbi:peptidylprolyl isomerase [Caulobacter sp. 17J80-11]|uniref:peptidylprolyl isomerase n=1 Tax=Caulobacter sp. 17J80-11 TaxID=2763502 RepID=UPI0016537D51|nr:peptidylprolyl isomerase [Caulobacter sp. 17J80-11]MBC6981200.1 peptidylprolyl isomerase [Caulobacter sp. 17J80-11]
MKSVVLAAVAALAVTGAVQAAPKGPKKPPAEVAPSAADWRALDPDNTLVIDTTKGRIVVELTPAAAPQHVERIKKLAREGFYDGQSWHRVIDYFMAQTGDPLGTGEGQSPYPDVPAEFTFRRGPELAMTPVARPAGAVLGFVGTLPIATQPDALMARTGDKKVHAWGLYCPGVAGMARGDEPDTANSQFFIMRQPYPALDKRYTIWGRAVTGLDVVRALNVGEPPENPDKMVRVRMMGDMAAADAPKLKVMDTSSKAFAALVDKVRKEKGADFSICDIEVPVQGG